MNILTQIPPHWRKRGLIVASLVLAYIVFGFLLLPRLIHNTLTETLASITHRPVTLAELKINPLTLAATLRGLEIGTTEQPFAKADEIYINFSLSSLWRGAYVFNAIRLQAPRAVIAIDREGRFNFQDMMPADNKKDSGPPPVIVIQSLEVLRGAIDFDDLSRPTPFRTNIATLDFTLRDFTTHRDESGNYQLHVATDLGETLDWQGALQATPFRSIGTLRLGDIHAETIWQLAGAGFKFDLKRGQLNIDSHYLVDFRGTEPQFQLDNMNVTLRDLHVLRRDATEPALIFPQLDIGGIKFDWQRRAVAINDVTLKDPQLHAVRDANGQIDLQDLFTPAPQPKKSTPAAASSSSVTPSSPWQITLANAQLQSATLQLEDQTTQPAANWQLTPFNLALHNIEIGTNKPINAHLDTGINKNGHAELNGTLTLTPFGSRFDLKLSSFDLKATQPYLQRVAQLSLRDGNLDVAGHIEIETQDTPSRISFTGDATVQKLRTEDTQHNEEFLHWEQLAIKEVAYDSRAARLAIKELALTKPYLRFGIGEDSTTNLSHILAAPATAPAKDSSPAAPDTQANAAPLITIKRVSVANGSLNFSDLSLKPSFSTGIQQLNGSIRGLSSKELARADVDLKGKVDRYAPAIIRGKINPLSDDAFTDLTLDFKGIEMTAFTPYSGKFAGYKIDKGKLDVELHYLLSKKFLQGDNKVVIDQLQLGKKVDSPDATGLPLRLAIAILKDANGVIDLDLPVSGRIDDPDFHYGRIVWMALKNVIIKVATAPFRALAALMGGNEEGANQVSFAPGKATLSTEELDKLDKLAQALAQRPGLLLEVRGTASASDATAIAATALEQRLATQPGTSRQQKMNSLYLKVYGVPAASLLPPPPKGETPSPQHVQAQAANAAEAKLLAAMVVSDDELRALAQERAQAIAIALTEGTHKIGADRVFLLDVNTKTEPGTAVIVPLSLQAR